MARIAEDLLLTLLDNESAQPQLQRTALGRVLAAALILDLALGCRV
ncbi:MAG TPA: GPP34 family phosphoprotein, partial [Mycobacterium sp.]|nr:GPP34 family phosphoprotein [Mycobacterium sp.]